MQQPDFWFKDKSVLSDILLPFSCLFEAAGKLRRALVRPVALNTPLICVGNINVGGTGKTPFCLYLAELLKREGLAEAPVFLSRMEDEAALLSDTAPVVIHKNRGKAALMAQAQGADIIIMDDGMQNPSVKPDLTFCVADSRGFGNSRVIPAGPLRERIEDALPRIDAFISYAPDPRLRGDDKTIFEARIIPNKNLQGKKYFAFCGIGNPAKFRKTLIEAGADLMGFEDFPDHHVYSQGDITKLKEKAASLGAALITTAKDKTKIDDANIEILDISVAVDDEKSLIQCIKTKLKK